MATFNFPKVERKVFKENFLDTVSIDLRYPTYLRLKYKDPVEISEAIRKRFPRYELHKEIEMPPFGTTEPEPIYKFATIQKDPVLSISTSKLVLSTKKYKSFEEYSSYIKFLIKEAIPHVDTTFFTRVGLRYVNKISSLQSNGNDILDWINNALVMPMTGNEIGSISNMKSEMTGPLSHGAAYTFRYGLIQTPNQSRQFVLDWDYYKEDVEVTSCMDLLEEFHELHFQFFWWALGEKAKEALNNDIVNR